jgi:phosphatidylglycerophosphatase A
VSPRPRLPLTDPAVLVATGFGSGLLRPAPGTWGSLLALAAWWWALSEQAPLVQLAAAALVFALGTWLTDVVDRRYGVGDDPRIVVDEVAGLWLALLGAPATPAGALAGFVLFRVFDIAKPWPIRWAERRLPGALGVMADDVVAGLAALIVLQLAFLALGWPTPLLSF